MTVRYSSSSQPLVEPFEIFNDTTGRWMYNSPVDHKLMLITNFYQRYNDAVNRSARRRVFDISEFKRLAALSVNRNADDVARFEKLAEGGFNRTFLVTMHDGFQLIGRIPYPFTEPKDLAISSEVATIDFLRHHALPVPKVYGYSNTAKNAAGTEYIFMEFVRGINLGDVWFDLSEKARVHVITKLVEMESRLFSLSFPAGGSLYYTKDLQAGTPNIQMPAVEFAAESPFCVGPDLTLGMWYGKRLKLQIDRGPYPDSAAALVAGANKEKSYLTTYGQPLLPVQRIRREIYDYQKQSHHEYLTLLDKYLQIAPHLISYSDESLTRPVIRHPDLQPNNMFISEALEVVGLIDWQHCSILPLFLQCKIPNRLQNYDDPVSDALVTPKLPDKFDELSEKNQLEQVELLRRRQLHYYYVRRTAELNPIHSKALAHDFSMLRRKLFGRASEPWEGNNVALKNDLIQLTKRWLRIVEPEPSTTDTNRPVQPCPITFTEDEERECSRLYAAQVEADESAEACANLVGVGLEGWVPANLYEETKQRERRLRDSVLEKAELEEEKETIRQHWIFDDFDEAEYA